MVAQNLMVAAALAALDWQQRLSHALQGDGAGAGQLLAREGSPVENSTLTQAEFDALQAAGTHDDFWRAISTLAGTAPDRVAMSVVNCGRSLALMGKLVDLLTNTYSRVVNVISAAGGSSQVLAVNQVHSLTVIPPVDYEFTLANGAAYRDQIDFTNENMPSGAIEIVIKQVNGNLLKAYDLAADETFYFTAVWDGSAWVVMAE